MIDHGSGGSNGSVDAEALADRLVAACAGLDEARRRAVAARLAAAGLTPGPGPGGAGLEPAPALRQRLHLGDGERLHADHAGELLLMLTEMAASLDQLVWSTWKQIAPKADVRRGNPLSHTLGRFAAADPQTPKSQARQDLERLRQLTASIVAAVSVAGRQFALWHAQRFAPGQIESAAKLEKKWHQGLDVAAWKKYRELAGSMDDATIEAEVRRVIAEFVEPLVRGLGK